MNREETKEAIKVMQAYCEGKDIQIKVDGEWTDIESPNWCFGTQEYRIKPEPTYRPYANAEECFADVKKHGGWVKESDEIHTNAIHMITTIGSVGVSNDTILSNFDELVKMFVWADDGTPCGILEE